MLRELRIKNLAIIDDLTIRFDRGFNVLTGETGAGKSIIVDALGLVLGGKVPHDFLRSGEKEAVVQAYFEPQETAAFPDLGLDVSDGLILRRSLFASGKHRAYINDAMVSAQSLAEVGREIVDIHGQHEHQSLLSTDKQREFLDLFGRLGDDRAIVERLYHDVSALSRERAELEKNVQDREGRREVLSFQIREIDAANLADGEIERLLEERAVLGHAGKLKELATTAYDLLYDADNSCSTHLSRIIRKVQDMAAIDQRAADVLGLLESALPLLEDAARSLRGFRDSYEDEPGRLDAVEERLALIRKLEKKYGEGIDAIVRYRNRAESELLALETIDERRDVLERELAAKERALLEAAFALSGKRKEAAAEMERLVTNELRDLAFENALFRIEIREGEMSPHGVDRIEFLFSANAGEPPKPLARIASGGELSRVMLALKTVFADIDRTPVLIFDEIDSGIGGKTAETVVKKLKNLSRSHQVLCTTHLAQLASRGDVHLKIEKKQGSNRVNVAVTELSGNGRLHEIARMLSGTATDISLRHARELLEGAGELELKTRKGKP